MQLSQRLNWQNQLKFELYPDAMDTKYVYAGIDIFVLHIIMVQF